MQAKMEVFEEETIQRIQQLLRGYAHLQKQNVGIQRRITESVTNQNFEMAHDLLRSQFEEYQQVHTQELFTFKNLIQSARFEIETDVLAKVEEMMKEKESQQQDLQNHKSEIYEYVQSKMKQVT